MLALAVTVALIVGLSLVPRSISWRKFEVPIAVAGILGAFGLGSWLLALAFTGVGTVAERFAARGVPAPLLLASPALFAVALVWLGRLRTRRPAPSPVQAEGRYVDDEAWYSSEWERDMDNPDHDPGKDGYRLELIGGPLSGRFGRLRDSRFRLWVAQPATGGELIVRSAIERPALQGVALLGAYEFSHSVEAMAWRPSA